MLILFIVQTKFLNTCWTLGLTKMTEVIAVTKAGMC